MVKQVCIIGGGNIGITCAVDISLNKNYKVSLLTKKAALLPEQLKIHDTESNTDRVSNSVTITDDENVALKNCDIVIVTVPSFLTESTVKQIAPFKPVIVFFFPGYGGKEFFSKILIEQGIMIAGLERVPYIARLDSDFTANSSKKKELACAAVNSKNTEYACSLIEDFFNIPCKRINNYLTISLTPSNPILHTARLYSLFNKYDFNSELPRQIKFYAEWDDFSSETLIGMDCELECVCKKLSSIDLSQFKTIREHYESFDIKAMTNKITSIPAFKNILSPLIKSVDDTSFKIDSESRYFKEDFMYGLCNLKGLADLAGIETPYMNKVLKWYSSISGLDLLDKNNKITGKDISKTGIPQIFGINSISKINDFYNKGR